MIRKDLDRLNIFANALAGRGRIQLGIFGNKSSRGDAGAARKSGGHKVAKGSVSGTTNAEVGMVMELGSVTRKIPPRSFLRMPIRLNSEKIMGDADYTLLAEVGGLLKFLKKVGIAAENVVQQAFASRGFGNWKPLKESTVARKGSDSPLIDTGQLRRSISSRVLA